MRDCSNAAFHGVVLNSSVSDQTAAPREPLRVYCNQHFGIEKLENALKTVNKPFSRNFEKQAFMNSN